MQLNLKTDYVIRILMYLAMKGESASSTELSERMGIPKSMIVPISMPLQKAGILHAQRGAKGGFVLIRKPEEISLSEIIKMMEETTRINRCLEEDHFCSRKATDTCPVRRFYVKVQEWLDETFENKTIAALLDDK